MAEKIYSAEEVRKRVEVLPEEIKKLLYSEEMYNIIKKIGDKYKLHIDQLGLLEAETGQVMLGFLETKNFSGEISDALHIGKAQADAIAQDINDQLFVKIRESMKKGSAPMPPAPPPPPAVAQPPKPPVPPPPPKPAVPPPPTPTTPTAPPKLPSITAADLALTQKTVVAPPSTPSISSGQVKPVTPTPPPTTPKPPAPPSGGTPAPAPKPTPPKPGAYTADPYREPPE
jgi:hypothetical protein